MAAVHPVNLAIGPGTVCSLAHLRPATVRLRTYAGPPEA